MLSGNPRHTPKYPYLGKKGNENHFGEDPIHLFYLIIIFALVYRHTPKYPYVNPHVQIQVPNSNKI